jgi:hypothetical protein
MSCLSKHLGSSGRDNKEQTRTKNASAPAKGTAARRPISDSRLQTLFSRLNFRLAWASTLRIYLTDHTIQTPWSLPFRSQHLLSPLLRSSTRQSSKKSRLPPTTENGAYELFSLEACPKWIRVGSSYYSTLWTSPSSARRRSSHSMTRSRNSPRSTRRSSASRPTRTSRTLPGPPLLVRRVVSAHI